MTPGAEERDDPDAGDAALYRQLFSLHRLVVESAEEGDDPDAREAALYRQLFTDLL